MKIRLDEAKFAAKVNERVNIPYLPESTEGKIFQGGVEATTGAIIRLIGDVQLLEDYGITVVEDSNPV